MTNPTSTEAAALAEALREAPCATRHQLGEPCRRCDALRRYDASLRAHANAASHSAFEQPDESGCSQCGGSTVRHTECGMVCLECGANLSEIEQPEDAGVGPVAWLVSARGKGQHVQYVTLPNELGDIPSPEIGMTVISKEPLYAAPPAIPHAGQDKARYEFTPEQVDENVRQHEAFIRRQRELLTAKRSAARTVTSRDVTIADRAYDQSLRNADAQSPREANRNAMRAALESFAAHHAAEGVRPQASGEMGDDGKIANSRQGED